MGLLDDREYLTPPDNEATKVYECYSIDNPEITEYVTGEEQKELLENMV